MQQLPALSTGTPWLRRAVGVSVVVHVLVGLIAWKTVPAVQVASELVDIDVAPLAPKAEALPAEVATLPEVSEPGKETEGKTAEAMASTAPKEDDGVGGVVDAGVDAAVDAAVDARTDAAIDARRDAAVDARPDAAVDAPVDGAFDAMNVAVVADAGVDATAVAEVEVDAGMDAAAVAMTADSAELAVTADAGADADAGAVAGAVAGAGAGADAAAVAVAIPDAAVVAVVTPDAGTGTGTGTETERGTGTGTGTGSGTGAGAGAGAGSGSNAVAVGRGTGSGSGAGGTGDGSGSLLGTHVGSGSGVPGTEDLPAVDGEPTTAGTAANLLSYFPAGQVVTAMIRFDRLRDTEWAVPTERLLKPLPDYVVLFGNRDARIAEKFDTLVISSPRPKDAAATILVGRTAMGRPALRDFLGATSPVTWSAAKGGLLGKRGRSRIPNDKRVFLSPFQGWFLLAQPDDVAGLTTPTTGDLDKLEATAKLPPWLAGIRKIEEESGDKRGPSLVLTLGFDGKKIELGDNDFGLGIKSVQPPTRVSLAMEIVKQGWLVRGNMKFGTDDEAKAFVAIATQAQARLVDSRVFQLALGKPAIHVIQNLSFARTGGRVSYATSVSIADARAILAVAALQLDSYFRPTH